MTPEARRAVMAELARPRAAVAAPAAAGGRGGGVSATT